MQSTHTIPPVSKCFPLPPPQKTQANRTHTFVPAARATTVAATADTMRLVSPREDPMATTDTTPPSLFVVTCHTHTHNFTPYPVTLRIIGPGGLIDPNRPRTPSCPLASSTAIWTQSGCCTQDKNRISPPFKGKTQDVGDITTAVPNKKKKKKRKPRDSQAAGAQPFCFSCLSCLYRLGFD